VYFQRATNEDEIALEATVENARLAADQESLQFSIELLTRASEIAAPDSLPVIQENIRAVEWILDIVID